MSQSSSKFVFNNYCHSSYWECGSLTSGSSEKLIYHGRRKGGCFWLLSHLKTILSQQRRRNQNTKYIFAYTGRGREASCLSPQNPTKVEGKNWRQWCREGAENTGLLCKIVQLVIGPPTPAPQGSQATALLQSQQGNKCLFSGNTERYPFEGYQA